MISSIVYVVVPVLVTVGAVRKYLDYKWGRYTSKKSLAGKVFIVTGANSGIGKETVRGLVERDAKVIMACRDIVAARKAKAEIRKTTSSGLMIPLYIDLASIESIRMFVNIVTQDYPEIHVLINNAAVATPDFVHTKDGFELHFGINYLGHFILTKLLLDKLKASSPSRVVILSSSLMRHGVIDFQNLNGERGWSNEVRLPGYCNSKLENAYFGYELARRTKDMGISVYTVFPGFCKTQLFRRMKLKWHQWLLFVPAALLFMRTARQGCQTVLYCAASDEVANQTGLIYRNCSIYKSPFKFDPNVSSKLWNATERLIKETGKIRSL